MDNRGALSGARVGAGSSFHKIGDVSTMLGKYLGDTYVDGGSIRNQAVTAGYYLFCKSNNLYNSIKFAWLGDAGVKASGGKVSKAYGLTSKDGTSVNAVQATADNQPFLGGNIAPNERYALKNPNGGVNYMTHPTISFGATDAWSVTTVLNWNGKGSQTDFAIGGVNTVIGLRGTSGNKIFIRNESNTTVASTTYLEQYSGKAVILTMVAIGNGTILIYLNGIYSSTITTASNITLSNILGQSNNTTGKLMQYAIRSQALTSTEVLAEATYLRTIYPEMANVVIGTQTWTTSNAEIVCTPQGNLIPEMQAAANAEKFTNCGGVGQTDWIDSNGDGLANTLAKFDANVVSTFSIVTGNGFVGNAQRVYITSNYLYNSYITIGIALSKPKYHKITFKYRSSKNLYISGEDGLNQTYVTTNIGDCVSASFYYYSNSSYPNLTFHQLTPTVGDWYEIDELSCQEVGWSDSQNLYDYISGITSGSAEVKQYAAVKAAAMWCHYTANGTDAERQANGAVYGKLYNWFAIKLLQMDIDYYNTANPTALWGWRVPTQADFTTLSTYLGGDTVSGGKMKVAGTTYWTTPNTGADNSSGFSLLPSGRRLGSDGSFSLLNQYGYCYGSGELDATGDRFYTNNSDAVTTIARVVKTNGNSIRLIKV